MSLVIGEILEAISYFLFHINDIINGDELIVTNLMTWESYTMETSDDYGVTKTVKIWDDWNLMDDEIVDITDVQAWNSSTDEEFIHWLFTNETSTGVGKDEEWNRFSFDLIELWLKNFEIHINAAAIMNVLTDAAAISQEGSPFGSMGFDEIFQGLDIEFYIMTHSLLGMGAFNDTNANGVPDVVYEEIEGENNVTVINGSELEYYFALGTMDEPVFKSPAKNAAGTGIEWSLRIETFNLEQFQWV